MKIFQLLLLPQISILFALIGFPFFVSSSPHNSWPIDEKTALFADFAALSAERMTGRGPQTDGHELAQTYIVDAFKEAGVLPFGDYRKEFEYQYRGEVHRGVNLLGWIPGRNESSFIVITAHYDHLGIRGSKVFHGADDNASGTAALLTLARRIETKTLEHSLIFLATDAEERGLHGAKAFVKNPPIDKSQLRFNVNLDMLSQGGKRNRLYVAGTRRKPELRAMLDELAEPMRERTFRIVFGHDKRQKAAGARRAINWQKASDHGAFLEQGIDILYFGVDPHKHYHLPSDTFEVADLPFYFNSVVFIERVLLAMDQFLLRGDEGS